jgi:hypothetical protein
VEHESTKEEADPLVVDSEGFKGQHFYLLVVSFKGESFIADLVALLSLSLLIGHIKQ